MEEYTRTAATWHTSSSRPSTITPDALIPDEEIGNPASVADDPLTLADLDWQQRCLECGCPAHPLK